MNESIVKGTDYYNYPYTDNPDAPELLRGEVTSLERAVHALCVDNEELLRRAIVACEKSTTPTLAERVARDHMKRVAGHLFAMRKEIDRLY